MKEPAWVTMDECQAIHAELLARFGGLEGIRDEGLLASALDRPRNLFAHACADLFALADAYAGGIIKNHPFLDGNKRAGFVIAALFLETNGLRFTASEEDVVEKTMGLAAGELSEEDYASWLGDSCKHE